MSKAEKFIEDCTRNCSNEILSPYPQIINDVRRIDGELAKEFSPWLTPDQARRAVEIARKELIEKVCSFIDDNIDEYIDVRGYTGDTFIDVKCDKFINDLKQAMNDE